MKKKKACCNSAISRWLGAYVAACQQTRGQAAKSPLKGSLSKGAYLNVLVFLCSSTFRHMYTEAGARSHTSFLVCICLAVFIVLPLSSLFHGCFSPLHPCYPTSFFSHCTPVTGLSSPKKTPLVPDNFQDDMLTLKNAMISQHCLRFPFEQSCLGAADKATRYIFICYISILLCVVTAEMIRGRRGQGDPILLY